MSDPSVGACEKSRCRFSRPFLIALAPDGGHGDARLLGQLDPLLLRALRPDAGAGDVQVRQRPVAAGVGVGPGGERQGERGDLAAALVDLQAVQVVAEHRIDGFGGGQAFLGHADRHEVVQRRDQEVPGPAARVEDLEFRGGLRPAVERARGRPPRASPCRSSRRGRSAGTPSSRPAARASAAVRLPSWRSLRPLAASFLPAHHAPSVLWSRNSTMYGSVKSCVTAESHPRRS